MAITDLTNTKWKFNDSITATSGYGKFNISTTEIGQQTYVAIGYKYKVSTETFTATANNVVFGKGYGGIDSGVFNQNTTDGINFTSSMEGQTLEITGGTDATNTNLISWLEQNATQVKDKITNLIPFLTSIANAIRKKKGTTEPINAQDFASEIESIETSGGKTIITFTLGTIGTFEAEEGMTWQQWVDSSYNTEGAFVFNGNVIGSAGANVQYNGVNVKATDTIIANATYQLYLDMGDF